MEALFLKILNMSLTGAALAAVVCAGVALAADQSSLYIDPAPVTAVSVSSRAADATHPLRQADMLDPAELAPCPRNTAAS